MINLKNKFDNLKIENISNIDDNILLIEEILQVFFHIN